MVWIRGHAVGGGQGGYQVSRGTRVKLTMGLRGDLNMSGTKDGPRLIIPSFPVSGARLGTGRQRREGRGG